MASEVEVERVWGALILAYPNYAKDLTAVQVAQTIKLYEQLLDDIPYDVLAAAAKQHIASSKWFPAVAELRQLSVDLIASAEPVRTGNEAWGIVLDTFTASGYYKYDDHEVTPEFGDPLIVQTVKSMGGYWHLYGCIRDPHGNPAADRARFIECYDALKRRQRDENMLLPIFREKREQLREQAAKQLTDSSQPQKVGDILRRLLPPTEPQS